jgi:hypothetical protein
LSRHSGARKARARNDKAQLDCCRAAPASASALLVIEDFPMNIELVRLALRQRIIAAEDMES